MPRATAPKMSEAAVLRAVKLYLRDFGVDVHRQNTGAFLNPVGRLVRFGEPGAPDLSGTLPGGRRIEVETKREGYRPRGKRERERFARQITRLNRLNEMGGAGLLVDHPRTLWRVLPLVMAGAKVWVQEDGTMEVTP